MRYSLLSVVVASTLALTACGNKQADNQAAGASATSNTATGATGRQNAVFTITGAGASFPQPIYAKWAGEFKTPLAVK